MSDSYIAKTKELNTIMNKLARTYCRKLESENRCFECQLDDCIATEYFVTLWEEE